MDSNTSAERHELLQSVYLAASELAAEQRGPFLDAQCAGDPALRAEVEELLVLEKKATTFLSQSLLGGERGTSLPDAETLLKEPRFAATPHPERVGRFTIEEVLGEGGMGVVYRAREDHPQRSVALKVLRGGSFSERALRRFEFEAQVLARLHHPGIAQIYEVGTADTGTGLQPWFAMELVEGMPLNDYVSRRRPSLRARLELWCKICDAVHHAHQRGVIHRDLKPANILVEEDGQPKILDFGVARAADDEQQAHPLRTDAGQLLGTICYMSPEQIGGDPVELDIRSDVYTLGLVGYEILTGRLPYPIADHTSLADTLRWIRELDPVRPGSLDRLLRGDVETILLKTLEKDKERRYASAAALADDIRRMLRDETISARPASTVYQLRKFTRRNRGVVIGALAVFFVMAASLFNNSVKTKIAEDERDRARFAQKAADERRKEAESAQQAAETAQAAAERERRNAEVQTEIAKAVNEFMDSILKRLSPSQAMGREVSLREFLEEAAKEITSSFPLQPEVRAAIETRIGRTYLSMNQFADSERHFLAARDLYELQRETRPEKAAEATTHLAALYIQQSRWIDAETLLKSVVDPENMALERDHPVRLSASSDLALVFKSTDRPSEAEALYLDAIDRLTRVLGPEHLETLAARHNLASLYLKQGRLDEAEELLHEVLDLKLKALGAEHPKTQPTVHSLAQLYQGRGRMKEAEELYRQTLAACRKVLGEHQHTCTIMHNLAKCLVAQERDEEAEPLLREAIAGRRHLLTRNPLPTYASMQELGELLVRADRLEEAEVLLEEARAGRVRLLGPGHADSLQSTFQLAELLRAQGFPELSDAYYQELLRCGAQELGPESPRVAEFHVGYGQALMQREESALAEQHLKQALGVFRAKISVRSPKTQRALALLIELCKSQGRVADVQDYELLVCDDTSEESSAESSEPSEFDDEGR